MILIAYLTAPTTLTADTIDFWRFDEADATDGALFEVAVSETDL